MSSNLNRINRSPRNSRRRRSSGLVQTLESGLTFERMPERYTAYFLDFVQRSDRDNGYLVSPNAGAVGAFDPTRPSGTVVLNILASEIAYWFPPVTGLKLALGNFHRFKWVIQTAGSSAHQWLVGLGTHNANPNDVDGIFLRCRCDGTGLAAVVLRAGNADVIATDSTLQPAGTEIAIEMEIETHPTEPGTARINWWVNGRRMKTPQLEVVRVPTALLAPFFGLEAAAGSPATLHLDSLVAQYPRYVNADNVGVVGGSGGSGGAQSGAGDGGIERPGIGGVVIT